MKFFTPVKLLCVILCFTLLSGMILANAGLMQNRACADAETQNTDVYERIDEYLAKARP